MVLDHSDYNNDVTGACNSGQLVGRALSHEQGYFVSQLTVSRATSDMNMTTVKCWYDDGRDLYLVDEVTILIPNGKTIAIAIASTI